MADSYPLPGRSIPGRADETPIQEDTAREALRGTEFDSDAELLNQRQFAASGWHVAPES